MKLSCAMLAAFAATAEAAVTADTDGSCQLMTATCNENGFEITFDSSCRDSDYKAVNWNELYANGPTLATSLHTFGTASAANAECRFQDVNNDGTLIRMNFNFKQCGTTHDSNFDAGASDSDAANLRYYNKIQGQEYYGDIILGVAVDFGVTCSANRVAEITTEADDISGDKNFESSDARDRPADWAQNVLNLDFYSDAGYTTALADNVVPFGETVYGQITTNVANEDIKTRVTDCWATEASDPASTPKFDLITGSCVANDAADSAPLDWVTLDSAANGATSTAEFFFRSFRFPTSNSFHLHCTVYMCYSDETCTTTCPATGRKRRDAETALGISRRDTSGVEYQENGLPVTNTLSAQILVPNASPSQPSSPVTKSQKVNKIANNLQKNFGAIQAALKKSRNQVRNLKKIFPQ